MSGRPAGIVTGAAAVALAGAVLGYAGERAVMTRERRRSDPAAGEDFAPPADALHHEFEMDDGGSLHAVERGTGRPLVLLHGITLSTDVWHYQLVDLATDFRVIAFDHRGHGRSTAGHEGTTMRRMAADVVAGLVALDLRDAIVVGHSMGGMVLQQVALSFPDVVAERVSGLVLLSTTSRPAPQLRVGPLLAGAFLPAARSGLAYAARVPGVWLPSNDLSYVFMRMGFGSRPSPSHVELVRTIQAATAPSTVAGLLQHVFEFDVLDDLGRIDLPTLVVVGERDLLTPPRIARSIARRVRGAELVVLPGCGHMAMLERHRQLDDLLRSFSARVASQ